jgi:hypothetical protein
MRKWDKKTALVTGLGAAVAAGAGYFATRLFRHRERGDRFAPALKDGAPPGPVGDSGNIRSAGAESMRDPPRHWDKVDEASDESFPASDPSNLRSHVD